jgi:integrase
MASICNDPNGHRRILFVATDGKRKTIRLGKVSLRQAEAVRVKVEDLVSSKITGHAPTDETSRWLAGLDDRMHDKLVAAGLTQPHQRATLADWLGQYLLERKGELKPESLRKLWQTRDKLLGHFDPSTSLPALTPQHGADWRQYLRGQKLSEAAIKTHCGNAKTMLTEAVRRKLISENPFQYLKSGPTPSRYTRYVTPDEINRIVDACPNAEWKLLFGLARYAGLRIPSESHGITPADVDWDRARLTVRSPKTEGHAGHEQRIVPIVPELMELLQARFDELADGEQHLVSIRGKGAVLRQVRAICKRAGVEPWKRLWQTLRGSCEKEWAMTLPQYAVSKWIGHSITVSGKHYANDVPDVLFEKAAQKAAHNPAQQAHAQARTASQLQPTPSRQNAENPVNCTALRSLASPDVNGTEWSRGELNPRPVTVVIPPLHV